MSDATAPANRPTFEYLVSTSTDGRTVIDFWIYHNGEKLNQYRWVSKSGILGPNGIDFMVAPIRATYEDLIDRAMQEARS